MRLTNSLEPMEALVRKIADASVLPGEFAFVRQQAADQNEYVRTTLLREAFGLRKEKKIERFIEYHQTTLVHLADLLVQQLSPAVMEDIHTVTDEDSYINLVKYVYARIEDLLVYIEKHDRSPSAVPRPSPA